MTLFFISPSISSSILLSGVIATATFAHRQPQQVRFGRSTRERSSVSSSFPLQRIRDVNAPNVPLQVYDTSALRRRRKLTSKPPMFSDMLAYEMSSYSMSMSLPSSFEFDFDTPTISTDPPNAASKQPPSSSPDVTAVPPTLDHNEESHYVKIMFEYLSECAGVELDTDTCLVSLTIDQLLSFEMDVEKGSRRILQSSNDCVPPPLTEQFIRSVMNVAIAKDHCHASDDEFNAVLDSFMSVFSATKCWESLCNPDAAVELLIRIMFEDAAQCAGVKLDVHECVYDRIIEMLAMTNAPTVRSLRRVLQQETEELSNLPCTTPSVTEINIFVSSLLNDSKEKCIASGFDLESSPNYWESVSSDLATIFSSPACWGVRGCQPEEESFVPVVAASTVEGDVRSIHLPLATTTTTTVSTDDIADDVPVMDDPTTLNAKQGNVPAGEKSKIHNAVFIAAAAGGLVAIAALVVGLRRSMIATLPKEVVIPVDEKSTDGSSDGQSSDGHHTANLSCSMTPL